MELNEWEIERGIDKVERVRKEDPLPIDHEPYLGWFQIWGLLASGSTRLTWTRSDLSGFISHVGSGMLRHLSEAYKAFARSSVWYKRRIPAGSSQTSILHPRIMQAEQRSCDSPPAAEITRCTAFTVKIYRYTLTLLCYWLLRNLQVNLKSFRNFGWFCILKKD